MAKEVKKVKGAGKRRPVETPAQGLTGKQMAFACAYLGEAKFNATEAARIAGYEGDHNTLSVTGHDNLRNPKIAAYVDKMLESVQMSALEVLSELSAIARSDWREHLTIKRDKDGNEIDATLQLKDKLKALELVGKHHKLFVERTELTGKDGGAIEVKRPEDLSDNELARIANSK